MRLHGEKAVEHAEKTGATLKMYGDHEPGRLAGLEEVELTVEQAKRMLGVMPFVVFCDTEEEEDGTATG